MHIIKSLLFAVLTAMTIGTQAQELNYKYVEAGYYQVRLDDSGGLFEPKIDPKGLYLRGSLPFSDQFYGIVNLDYGRDSFSRTDTFDFGNGDSETIVFAGDLDVTTLELGLGYRMGLGERTDFLLGAALIGIRANSDATTTISNTISNEMPIPFSNEDTDTETGYLLGAELRGFLTENFEYVGQVQHIDIFDSELRVGLGGTYHFSQRSALNFTTRILEEETDYTFGYRYSF